MFAIEWTLATTAAVLLATLAVEILFVAVLGYYLLFLFPFIGGSLVGVPVAVFQWLVLRRQGLQKSGWWLLATPAGFLGAWIVAVILIAFSFTPHGFVEPRAVLVAFAIATPVLGFAQAAVLRLWTSGTMLWVPATVVAWVTFVTILLFGLHWLAAVSEIAAKLESWIAGYEVSSALGAALIGGLCAGGITGIALMIALWDRLPDPV
jgi:hypothetical protein